MSQIRLRNVSRVYDLFRRLEAARDRRPSIKLIPYTGAKELKTIGLDTVAYPGFGKRLAPGQTHKMDGSKVTLWYKAMHKPTKEQIDKASYAVDVLKMPRRRYTGTLVDVFESKGTLYCLLAGVLERDREKNRHHMNFRMMNLDDGELYCALVDEVERKPKTSPIKSISKSVTVKTVTTFK